MRRSGTSEHRHELRRRRAEGSRRAEDTTGAPTREQRLGRRHRMRRRWLERTDGRGGEDSSEDLTSSDDSERGDRSYSDLGIGDLRDEHRDDYEQDDDDERYDGGAPPGSAARPIAVQGRADDDEQDEDDAPLSGPKERLLAALQQGLPQPSSACSMPETHGGGRCVHEREHRETRGITSIVERHLPGVKE